MIRTCTECGHAATHFSFFGQQLCLCSRCHKDRLQRVERLVQQLMKEDRAVLRGVVHVVEEVV